MTFFETSFLWFEAVIASTAIAAACAVIGVYTIFRKVVFLPAALSQLSGLTVAVVFAFGVAAPSLTEYWFASPTTLSIIITSIGALTLGWMPEPKRFSRGAIIGIVYICASAFIILITDKIPQESHQIEDILFGNAVAVSQNQMFIAVAASGITLLIHVILIKSFLLVSFDRDTAFAQGTNVKLIDSLLFFTLGLTISVATKTIGAMPVFAFTILPSTAALAAFNNSKLIFISAALMGALSAFGGYWLSFSLEMPTGACSVAVLAFFLPLAWLIQSFKINPT